MQSMTGFGRSEVSNEQLDLQAALPKDLGNPFNRNTQPLHARVDVQSRRHARAQPKLALRLRIEDRHKAVGLQIVGRFRQRPFQHI